MQFFIFTVFSVGIRCTAFLIIYFVKFGKPNPEMEFWHNAKYDGRVVVCSRNIGIEL